MPSLCLLTQYYPPEMGAPQVRLSELATRLIGRGWQVDVLTALPNYPRGKIFEGYDRWKPVVEECAGARVVRVPLYPAQRGFAKRLISYFSFVASASTLGPTLCRHPDLLVVESPPLFIGYAAWALSSSWRVPYVLNVSDLWPESAVRIGMLGDGLALRLARDLERRLYLRSAGVTGQSDGIIDGVQRTAPGVPTAVITNGADPTRFGPSKADDAARTLIGAEPGPIFLFAGLLGHAQNLGQLLDLAKSLPSHVPGRFVLVGDGPERQMLVKRVRDEGITRVRIVGEQPHDRIPALLAASHCAITTMSGEIPGMVPSKIYEAMASHLPILLMGEGEPARRIRDADCGLSVPPGDLAGARSAVERLANDHALRARLGANGREAAETTYNRDRIAERLDTFLRAAVEVPSTIRKERHSGAGGERGRTVVIAGAAVSAIVPLLVTLGAAVRAMSMNVSFFRPSNT